jgi:hypothetical protein
MVHIQYHKGYNYILYFIFYHDIIFYYDNIDSSKVQKSNSPIV